MSTAISIIGIIDIILCVVLIFLVAIQEGDSEGLGSLAGSRVETFFGQNREQQSDRMLKRLTTGLAIAFGVLTIVLNFMIDRL